MSKVYLLYEKPFWSIPDGKVLKNVFLWNDAERKSIESDVSFTLLKNGEIFNLQNILARNIVVTRISHSQHRGAQTKSFTIVVRR